MTNAMEAQTTQSLDRASQKPIDARQVLGVRGRRKASALERMNGVVMARCSRRSANLRLVRSLNARCSLAVTPAVVFLLGAGGDGTPTIKPDKTKAPGASGLQDAINGFAYYALLASAAGFLLGGAVWAVGGRAGNDYAAAGGKVGMAVAVGVAFLVGAATAILKFAYSAGGT